MFEPNATATLLAIFGVLMIVSVLFSRASERFSVPVALVFLAIGVAAGSEGLGGIPFEDYGFAYRLGTAALVFILFDGGLNTPMAAIRSAARPASVLATIGVIGTAALLAGAARFLGVPWPQALLLGAVVSSTDAAAVFAVLRGSGLSLKRRVGTTLEVESGINDPMAVILTMTITQYLIAPGDMSIARAIGILVLQVVIGGAAGYVIGVAGRQLLSRIRLPVGGLYPALTLGIACIAFSLPTLMQGSGFLAVYITAVIIGNSKLPYKSGLLRVHDALAWLSQIVMFLVFGLLVFPSRLQEFAWLGLVLSVFLAFVARPVVVALCLAPFRQFKRREVAYVGWVGLRGAVPIILATFPVLAGIPAAQPVFDIVFFIVVVNAFIPGATVPWVTRKLGLTSDEPPPPRAVLEIESVQPLEGELFSFYIDEVLAVAGVPIGELGFPGGSSPLLIVRGKQLLAPKAEMVLTPGDHLYVFAMPEDREMLHLMFGVAEHA